jgi:hypothetical protein
MYLVPSDAWTETISKEAEEQANSYFQAVYHGKMTVDQLLTVLKQLRSSTVKKERVSLQRAFGHCLPIGIHHRFFLCQCYLP